MWCTLPGLYRVPFKRVPRLTILSLRKIIPSYHCEGILWGNLFRFIQQEHLEMLIPSGHNNIAIYHDQEHKDSEVQFLGKASGLAKF
jgi:hypothetical protein